MNLKPSSLVGIAIVIIGAIVSIWIVFQYHIDSTSDWSGVPMPTPRSEVSPVLTTRSPEPLFTGERILLTHKNYKDYWQPPGTEPGYGCTVTFNGDPANTVVTLDRPDLGFRIDLPFNENWGTDKLRLLPYDEHGFIEGKNLIEFGRLHAFEGCGWVREYFITVLPQRSAEQVIRDWYQEVQPPDDLFPPEYRAHRDTVHGLEVVKWVDLGLCGYPTMEVIGMKYNYRFSPICGFEDDEMFEFWADLIKTMQLID